METIMFFKHLQEITNFESQTAASADTSSFHDLQVKTKVGLRLYSLNRCCLRNPLIFLVVIIYNHFQPVLVPCCYSNWQRTKLVTLYTNEVCVSHYRPQWIWAIQNCPIFTWFILNLDVTASRFTKGRTSRNLVSNFNILV